MNNFRKLTSVALLITACLLAGCAVMRVDVDVYKGPLSNHEDVQTRQYVALALAARPILAQLRAEYETKSRYGSKDCLNNTTRYLNQDKENKNNSNKCFIQSNLARRLNVILSYYEDIKSKKEDDKDNKVETTLQKGRLPYGLETLIENYLKAKNSPPEKDLGQLEEMLLLFAERILFIANNQTMLEYQEDRPSTFTSESTKYILTLQSIGNSIITHANDLRFRRDHRNKGADREPSERNAAIANLKTSAAQAFDSILSEFRLRAERAASDVARLPKLVESTTADANSPDITKLRRIVHAYRTVTGRLEPLPEMPLDAADRVEIGINARDVKAIIEAKQDNLDGKKASGNIKTSLQSRRNTYGEARKSTASAARLDEAISFFGDEKNQFSRLISQDSKKTYNDVLDILSKEYVAAVSILKKYHENKDLQDRNQSAKNAQEEVKTASTTLQAARTLVESLRGEVLADVSKQENASKTLIEVLKNAISAKKSGENTAPHNTALEVLNTFSPPTNLAVQTLTSQSQNPSRRPQARDVLDDVIASLRHARIQATQAGQTETIKNIDNALKFAFDQRGGLAYLRPASAYLRDVYAGSSLQNDPKLEWSNMLSEHMLRGVPVLGAYRANEDRDLREVRTEIDKQHWQTINSVRVAGAGNTNYVVAKDDIGNWYVKGYDADPAPIIRSAQNLALFNLGGKIGANLLARQDILSELQNKDNPPDQERRTKLRADLVDLDKSDGKGNTAGLSGVLGRFQVSYRKRLDDDFKKLQDEIVSEKLLNNLKRDWDSALAVSDFKTHLDKFKTIAAKDATGYGDAVARLGEPTAKPESPERAEAEIAAILDALRALRRYHSVVLMHIDSVTANGGDIAGLTRKAEDARSREAGLKLLVEKSTSEVIATQQTMDKISPAEAEKAKSLLDKKKADEDEAKKVLGKATAERVDAEKALADANKTADTAIQARRIARSTATRTILGFVTSYTSSRVESARQYEEVATFVTEAGR